MESQILNEEQLMRKAIHHVREYSRPLPRKRRMDEDPSETSESESKNHNREKYSPLAKTTS